MAIPLIADASKNILGDGATSAAMHRITVMANTVGGSSVGSRAPRIDGGRALSTNRWGVHTVRAVPGKVSARRVARPPKNAGPCHPAAGVADNVVRVSPVAEFPQISLRLFPRGTTGFTQSRPTAEHTALSARAAQTLPSTRLVPLLVLCARGTSVPVATLAPIVPRRPRTVLHTINFRIFFNFFFFHSLSSTSTRRRWELLHFFYIFYMFCLFARPNT